MNSEKHADNEVLSIVSGTIIDTLLELTGSIKYEPFFEILMTLAKSHNVSFINKKERFNNMVKKLVDRCIKEINEPSNPTNPNVYIIRI